MTFPLERSTGISPFDNKSSHFDNKIGAANSINGKVEKMMATGRNYLDFLNPLYRVLNAIGVMLPKSSNQRNQTERFPKDEAVKPSTIKSMGFRNWLMVLFCYIYLLHSFIAATMVSSGGMNFLKWSAVIQRIIETTVAVFSVNHFLSSQADIYTIFGSCTKYISQLPATEVARLRKKCRRIIIYIVLGLLLGYATLPDSLKDTSFYLGSSFYGLNATEDLSHSQSSILVAMDFTLRNVLDTVSLCLMFAFVTVSYYIGASAKFYELKLIETKDNPVVTPESLHQVQKYHGEITDLCQRADAVFTRITLAWYFDLVQRFLLLIPAILTSVKRDPFHVYFGLSIQFLYYSYVFTVMSLSASKVKEVSHDGMLTVHRIANKIPSSDWHSLNLIVNLMGMMSTSQMHLTAWNFFIIDRSLILTVLSMVLTYTVVVIQFFSVN